jgi:hypothetical protein
VAASFRGGCGLGLALGVHDLTGIEVRGCKGLDRGLRFH